MFLSVFAEAALRHPLHRSLQKGSLALTSAGAKHLTVVQLQPSDPSKWNFELFLEKISSIGLLKVNFPSSGVWAEKKKFITHIIVEVIYFPNLRNQMAEKTLLHPPMKISSPCLPVPKKRKAEVSTAITETIIKRGELPLPPHLH